MTIIQPDGSTLTVLLHGDEWCHWTTDLDGNLLVQNDYGFYHIANAVEIAAWENKKAQQLQRRVEVNAARHARLRNNRRAQVILAKQADSTYCDSIAADSIVYDPDSLACDSLPDPHFGFPAKGKMRGLVVLVEFQDRRFTIDAPHQAFTDMLTKDGYDHASYKGSRYKHIGSAHDYFYQNSCGQFDPQFDVYGPILLKDSIKHYSWNDDRFAWQMIKEACDYLDDSLAVDFNDYDTDGDNVIDFVFAFFAGQGENATSRQLDIWPHAWDVQSASGGQTFYYDNKLLLDYACSNELSGTYMDGIGPFCHEFTHVLGLPDLYDTSGTWTPACTPQSYDLLDNGCYNWNNYIPAGLSAYERYELGWLVPMVLSEQKTDTLLCLSTSNQAFIVPVTEGIDDPREGEYYLFENRQLTSWDSHIPGHGMLVWHIDYKKFLWSYNSPNNWPNHQCIDLVEAGGKKYGGYYYQDGSVPFPGTKGITAFTDDTTPAFSGWTKPGTNSASLTVRLEKPISNIQELEYVDETGAKLGPDIITFDFRTAPPAAIQAIELDVMSTAPRTAKTYVNGQLLIQTEHGTFDAMGRRK